MGMFDSVYVVCPHCDKETELQSKSGHCRLDSFYQHKVPVTIAKSLEGIASCDLCGNQFEIYSACPEYVPLYVSKIRREE